MKQSEQASADTTEHFRQEAYPLVIYNQEKNKFEINEETRDFLRQLEGPIGVISVAGMYRTGKSYLLNRMLLNQSKGFDVGPTINACTKGVWIWGNPIDGITPEGDPIKVLVLDTEGLGALDEDSNHDVRIFSLAILLASFFIYNSVGSIDENALNQLSLVINLTKHIQIKAGGVKDDQDPDEYAQYFPSFMWVVRDFTLQLMDADQEPITSKEYLEKALSPQKGFSEMVESKNRIRRLLKSFFKERDCCTMIRPLTKEDQLQNLAEMDLEQLRPEFVEQVQTLRRKVINRIKPKQMYGRKLNGDMLFNLAHSYVEAINNGAVPSIENSWSYICRDECHKANQEALQLFESKFYQEYQQQVPMYNEELQDLYKIFKKDALLTFNKKAVGDVREEFLKDLKEKMQNKLEFYKRENEKTAENDCSVFMQQEFQQIDQQLRNQQYPDVESLNSDIKMFEQYSVDNAPKGPYRNEQIYRFCFNSLAEGAVFINRGIMNDLTYIEQVAEQTQSKLRNEIQEQKQRFNEDLTSLQEKLRQQEVEKAEFQAREQATREHLLTIQQEKQRQEQDYEQKLQHLKQDSQLKLDELQQKFTQQEEDKKELSRRQMQTDLEFDKAKALMEQQIQFITKRNQDLEAKESKLNEELKKQKQDSSTLVQDQKTKYESKIQDLQQKNQDLQESVFELEDKITKAEHELAETLKKQQDSEQSLNLQLTKLKEAHQSLQKQTDDGKVSFQEKLDSVSKEKEQKVEEQKQVITELEQELKEAEDEIDQIRKDFEIQIAKHEQSQEFLKVKYEQEREAREKEKRDHATMLKTIQSAQRESVIGKEEATKQLDELRAQFTDDLQLRQQNFDNELSLKDKENNELSENCQKLEFQLQQKDIDFKKDLDSLRENLQQAEIDRDKLQKLAKDLERQKSSLMEDAQEQHHQAITQLEQELEDCKFNHEQALQEIQTQSEQQLNNLKEMFESDKQKFRKRMDDEKDRATKRMHELQQESEQARLEEKMQYEDDLEYAQNQLKQVEDEYRNTCAYYDQEVSLRDQNINGLSQQLKETKETLDKQASNFQLQLEQVQQKSTQDRKELTEKVDSLNAEIAKRERICTNLENQKDSLTQTVSKTEKQNQLLKEENLKQQQELQLKWQEVKQKLEEKEDELTQKKIEFERQSALQQQQIQFTEQKASDLAAQLERTQVRYDERSKIDREEMQRDLKEKTSRLQAEKENSEAKFEAKRKQVKELESRLQKENAKFDTQSMELRMKQQNLQEQWELRERNLEEANRQLREAYQSLSDSVQQDQAQYELKLQQAERAASELESKLQDEVNKYDKEAALWEGKNQFLEQQREQYKRDLDEAQQKFQQSIDSLTKQQTDSKTKADNNHNLMINQLQSNLQQRLKEQQEQHQQQSLEMNQKVKQLEREKNILADRLELSNRDQITEAAQLQKKLEKTQDQLQRSQEDNEQVKKERDAKVTELMQRLEKEREQYNQKKRELDQRGATRESKHTELLLTHEKERAKWDQQLTDLIHQREDFKSENDRLKVKVDTQFKEIEKLKLEARNARKSAYQPGQGGNMTGQVGTGLVSKLNLNRQSGYQPGLTTGSMFNTNRSIVPPNDNQNPDQPQPSTENRYSSGRYQPQGMKDVTQSVEFSKMGGPGVSAGPTGFLSQSIALKPGQPGTGFGSQLSNNIRKLGQASGGNAGPDLKLAVDEQLDTKKNLVSTPSSKNDDNELE